MTLSIADDDYFDVLPRQLAACLDVVPAGRDWPLMANGRDGDRLAAILVPLIWQRTGWQILLTKRAAHLSHHAGQISFPGGKLDPTDAGLIDAALREAEEEINLLPPMVKIMGGLLPVRSPAGFIVQPIVGIIAQDIFSHLHPDPAEVDGIFTMPLAHIGQSENFTKVPRQTDGRDNSYWVVAHPVHYIWGLSARVLNDLRQRLYRGQT